MIKKYFYLIILCIHICLIYPAKSCTLWAVTGDRAKDGKTIIVKNRDWAPDNCNEIRIIKPDEGFAYIALYAAGGNNEGVKGGINEKGLVIISASASTLPKEERFGDKGFMTKILTSCNSVDGVLKEKELISKASPMFYMVADRKTIAFIEIGLNGKYFIRKTENGILYHTNHYTDSNLKEFNKKENQSSYIREKRIKELLESHSNPLNTEDFIKFSEDKNDGPDNSIWRTGSTPEKTRTLATWIVEIPKNDVPCLYVKFANPGEEEKIYEIKIENKFWIFSE